MVSTRAQIFSTTPVGNSLTTDQKLISDTTSKKQITTDDKIKIFSFTKSDTSRKSLDTSIQFLHRNPFLSAWEMDLGNLGTPANSLLYNPDFSPTIRLGTNGTRRLMWNAEEVKYYNTTRPFTQVFYRLGTKQEQALKLLHTQNVTPRWNISASYQKLGSPGFYKLQKTNHDNALIGTNYTSRNLRYNLKGAITYNKFQQDENKGITDEDFLLNKSYNDRRLIPVNARIGSGQNRSATTNYLRSAQIDIEQQYFLGKADSIYNQDSTEKQYTFKPIAGIKHRFYTEYNHYRFNDLYPDSLYNENLPDTDDSLTIKYFLDRLGNSISLTGNLRLKDKVVEAEAGYGIEVDRASNGIYKNTFMNNYLFASIHKNGKEEREWNYNANVKFYFTGNALGNTSIQGSLGKNINKYTSIHTGLNISVQSPTYIQSNYNSNYFNYTSTLGKQSINKVYASYQNTNQNLHTSLNYFTIGNFIYYDSASLQAKQYSKIIPLLQLQVQKEFQLRHFYLLNEVVLQTISNNPALHIPRLTGRHILSYQNFILKKKLQIATGIEARYNTSYFADFYNPYIYGFAAQNARMISNTPQLNYFFNFKVKRYRASISFDELQTFYAKNNINYSGYAAQNFCMRFGFYWVFIN